MNQKSKNITLVSILGMLVICSVVLALTKHTTINTIGNKVLFSVEDTSEIDRILISAAAGQKIELVKKNDMWMLNERFKAEQNIVKVLLSILKDMEVSRNVPKSQQEAIVKRIHENGYLVEIYVEERMIRSFLSVGNENKTVSYMMQKDEDQPLIINIPGYRNYVAGIFEIPLNDWRDRLILSANWHSLQELSLNYSGFKEHDFTIRFKNTFLTIDGIHELDTSAMMTYIENFSYLQTDRYLDPGQNAKYDSLLKTPETAEISVKDIDPDNSKNIRFFPLLPDDPMMLAHFREDNQMVLFEARRIQHLFAVKSDFEKQK